MMNFSLRRVRVGNVVLGLLMVVGLASAQTTTGTQQRPTSTPYSGDLSIFEYPDRDKKLQIDRVMDLLGITTGKNVADIGAGSGWFTVRASRRVGPTGAVIAEDINPQAIEYISKRVVKENLPNVRTELARTFAPGLGVGCRVPQRGRQSLL